MCANRSVLSYIQEQRQSIDLRIDVEDQPAFIKINKGLQQNLFLIDWNTIADSKSSTDHSIKNFITQCFPAAMSLQKRFGNGGKKDARRKDQNSLLSSFMSSKMDSNAKNGMPPYEKMSSTQGSPKPFARCQCHCNWTTSTHELVCWKCICSK